MSSNAMLPRLAGRRAVVPVEYAVAVDRFLDQASLSPASRRVYRISLTGWAWPLVGRPLPSGRDRRGAPPPVVSLAVLDSEAASQRLAAAVARRAAEADARTVNRELSALRSAVGWWQDQEWIERDPTAGLRNVGGPSAALPALSERQVARLLGGPASLREHSFWRVIYDAAARPDDVLALDIRQLDLAGHRTRAHAVSMRWSADTSERLGWLLAGRASGPVFLTDRRAPATTAPADVCPVTRRGRMSYRRAAEIFGARTRALDPEGREWTLHQLRLAGQRLAAYGAR